MSAGEKLNNATIKDESDFTLSSLIAAGHELKSPLALIRQISLVLRDDSLVSSEKERSKLLEHITLTSERSLRLVDMLTRYARLEDALFQIEPVNAVHICEKVADGLWPLSQAAQRSIVITAPRKQPVVVANRDLLEAIIFGLCDNSFAYATSSEPIELSVGSYRGRVRVSVRDHGPAIPTNVFQKMQQRLGKTVQPMSERPQSSGLGLYVAGRFAQAMQGQLGAIRHRLAGVTFYVDVPASAQLSLLSHD